MNALLPPDHDNPYAAPLIASPAIGSVTPEGFTRPRYYLYSVGSMILATFFGTVAAGAVLLAINYQRLGRPIAARLSLVVGLSVWVASLAAVALWNREEVMYLMLPQLLAMAFVAYGLQGKAIATHRRHFGLMASPWKALGVGILGWIVWTAAVTAGLLWWLL